MHRILLSILFVLGAACSPVTSPTGEVFIRLENQSSLYFDRVLVGFPAQQEEYDSVPPYRRSGYRQVTEAYRYAYVRVYAGEQVLVLQPVDYVGEHPLEAGRYTYLLGIDASGKNLALALRQDR